jgi:hypothetical protein
MNAHKGPGYTFGNFSSESSTERFADDSPNGYWQPFPLPLSPLFPLPQLDGLTFVGFVVGGGSFLESNVNENSFGKPAIIILPP